MAAAETGLELTLIRKLFLSSLLYLLVKYPHTIKFKLNVS